MSELGSLKSVPTPPNATKPPNAAGVTAAGVASAIGDNPSDCKALPSKMKLSPLKINKAIAELQKNKNSTEALLQIDANVFAGIFLRKNLSNAENVTQTLKALTGEDSFRKNEKVSQLCTKILNSVSESDSVEKLQRGIEITTFLLYAALKEGSPKSGEIHEVCLKLKAMARNDKFSAEITDETRHLLNYTMGKPIKTISGKGKSNRLTMKDYRLGGMGFSQDQIDHSVSSIKLNETTNEFDLESFTTRCGHKVVDLNAKVEDVRRDEGKENLKKPSLEELHATFSKISADSADFAPSKLRDELVEVSRQMESGTWDYIAIDSEIGKYRYDPGKGQYRHDEKSVVHDFQCEGQESTFLQVRNLDKQGENLTKDNTELDKAHLENSDILLVHLGGEKGGHYVTCVKALNDQWVVYNDGDPPSSYADFNALEAKFVTEGHPLNQNVVAIGQTPSKKTVEELERAGGIKNPNQYCFQIAALQALRAMPFSQHLDKITVNKTDRTIDINGTVYPIPDNDDFQTFFISNGTSESPFDLLKKALDGNAEPDDLSRLLKSIKMYEEVPAPHPFIKQQDSCEFLTKIFAFFTDFPQAVSLGLVPKNLPEIRDNDGNITQHNLPKIAAATDSSLTVSNGPDPIGFKYTEQKHATEDEAWSELVDTLDLTGLKKNKALFPHLQMLKALKNYIQQPIDGLTSKINVDGDNSTLSAAIIKAMSTLPQTAQTAALENFFVNIASEEMLNLYLTQKYPQHKPAKYDETLALIEGFTNPASRLIALRTFALTLLKTPAPVEVQATQNAARVSSNGSAVLWHRQLRENRSAVIVPQDPNMSQCIKHGFCSADGNVMISRLNSDDSAKKHMVYVVPPMKQAGQKEADFLKEVENVTRELFETVKAYNIAVANEADKITTLRLYAFSSGSYSSGTDKTKVFNAIKNAMLDELKDPLISRSGLMDVQFANQDFGGVVAGIDQSFTNGVTISPATVGPNKRTGIFINSGDKGLSSVNCGDTGLYVGGGTQNKAFKKALLEEEQFKSFCKSGGV